MWLLPSQWANRSRKSTKITPPFQAIRYAEAMDRRDFIFDVLLEEAEFYLIGGGNG